MSTQLGKPVSSDASMRVPLIMDGEGLPDVILCNDTLARLYVNIDTVAWTATYANAPWSGCRLPLPLQPNHDCMAADATTCGVSGGGGEVSAAQQHSAGYNTGFSSRGGVDYCSATQHSP